MKLTKTEELRRRSRWPRHMNRSKTFPEGALPLCESDRDKTYRGLKNEYVVPTAKLVNCPRCLEVMKAHDRNRIL